MFGFPGAGGSIKEQIVHYIEREKPNGSRIPVRIGEIDGEIKDRTKQITLLFENSKIPVELVNDIDGWLKYHAAFVIPIGYALERHGCNNYALAKDEKITRLLIRACREGGDVLQNLGYIKRQPFRFNLFYWIPDFITAKIFQKMFNSKFAEIGFALHAKAALDEMKELGNEFRALKNKTSIKTPNLDELISCLASN